MTSKISEIFKTMKRQRSVLITTLTNMKNSEIFKTITQSESMDYDWMAYRTATFQINEDYHRKMLSKNLVHFM